MIKQKHQQLFDILMLQFRSGRWKKGEKLPSFRDLAQEYGVSINVVSKAIELLKEAGIVSVRVGDGVFSTAPSEMIKQEVRYSGNRIFGQYASAKVHRSVKAEKLCDNPRSAADYRFFYDGSLPDLIPEEVV